MQFFTFRNTLASNRIEASFECKYADQLLRFNGCIKLIQIYIQRGPAHDSRARPIHHCYHYYHHRVSRFTPRGCGFIIRRERERRGQRRRRYVSFSREKERHGRGALVDTTHLPPLCSPRFSPNSPEGGRKRVRRCICAIRSNRGKNRWDSIKR